MKLAYAAALDGFNALIEFETNGEKVRNFGYQTYRWSASGVPYLIRYLDEHVRLARPDHLTHSSERPSVGRLRAKTEKVGPEMRAFRRAPSFRARHAQRPPANAFRIGPRAVTFEAHDRDLGCTADRGDDKLPYPVAREARAFAESFGDIGARLDLHFATHPVRSAHDPDDGILGANRSRG